MCEKTKHLKSNKFTVIDNQKHLKRVIEARRYLGIGEEFHAEPSKTPER